MGKIEEHMFTSETPDERYLVKLIIQDVFRFLIKVKKL